MWGEEAEKQPNWRDVSLIWFHETRWSEELEEDRIGVGILSRQDWLAIQTESKAENLCQKCGRKTSEIPKTKRNQTPPARTARLETNLRVDREWESLRAVFQVRCRLRNIPWARGCTDIRNVQHVFDSQHSGDDFQWVGSLLQGLWNECLVQCAF